MIRFYAPDILETGCLPESDSGHAIRVLRMHVGDKLMAVDGRGHVYSCRLADENARHAAVDIVAVTEEPPVWTTPLTVMVAPTKLNDRMEWLLEKLVETGVDRFAPVLCAHSERKVIKEERLLKIAVSAMKQSLKATLPEILPMMPLKDALHACDAAQRFVGYCDADTPRLPLAKTLQAGLSTAILIGPEGDFTPDEIAMARDAAFLPVTMGDNRLRTETAALTAAITFHVINQQAT